MIKKSDCGEQRRSKSASSSYEEKEEEEDKKIPTDLVHTQYQQCSSSP